MRKLVLLLLLLVISPLKAEIYNIDQLDLKGQAGKVVYLDFWASWCKPCRESFPGIVSVDERPVDPLPGR